jgi:hypothetical protein
VSLEPRDPGIPSDPGAPLYVDGSPLDGINFYQISADKFSSKQRGNVPFWSSLPRRQADPTVEVFDVAFTSSKLVNTISFNVARFPHRVRAEYMDKDGNWQPLRQFFGVPVAVSVLDSLPAVISPLAVAQGAAHPQHYGAGHWLQHKMVLRPVKTRRIRLLLSRGIGAPPVDTNQNAVPYSLGIRDFHAGYKVTTKKSIPKTQRHPTIRTEFNPFETGLDALESPLAYVTRENRASDLTEGISWRSEPQPIPDAVVNLYLDARDVDGEPQIIDRFHIDPLTPGVQMNVYWSVDDTIDATFKAQDDLITPPRSYALGSVTPLADRLRFNAPDASVTIDNRGLQWRTAHDWWIGMNVAPQYGDDDVQTRVLFDADSVRITLTNGVLDVEVAGTSVSSSIAFTAGTQIPFIVVYSGGILSLHTVVGFGQASVGSTPGSVQSFRLGSNLLDLIGSSETDLLGLVLKQETTSDSAALYEDFVDNFTDYLVKPLFDDDDTGRTDNALLRYHPDFQTTGVSSLNPLGFLGGPGDKYEGKEWTPVARDFRLQRGMLHFPPVNAKYFKFEFTELVAEPYETYAQVVKTVKRHPQWLLEENKKNKGGKPRKRESKGGLEQSVDQTSASTHYRDEARQVGNVPRRDVTSPTTSVVATDPTLAQRMRQISSYFNLVKWLPDTLNTKWSKGKHTYQTVEMDHVNRVAYFVGLNSIEMFRLDYAVDDDSEQYIEVFHDADNLDLNEWNLMENSIQSEIPGSTMQSKVLRSRRKVRAVQFATVQMPAVQLLSDPDFLDTTLANWDPFGDASALTFSQELETDLGTTVRVSRNSGFVGRDWNDTEFLYPNWNLIEGVAWDDVESDGSTVNYGGITGNQNVITSAGGRAYAAARVYVNEELTQPLYIQIVTPSGEILSEEEINPTPGQITEWYTGYTIGGGGPSTALSWDDMETTYADWDALDAGGTWGNVAQETQFLATTVLPRIVQYGLTDDEWDVDNISLFNDPILWEFSNDGGTTFYPVFDIRNNADGVFTFPDADVLDPSPGFSTKLVWRATGYYAGAWVSSLLIRPWYTGLSLGIPHREAIQYGGPNQSPWDDYPEIHEDPHFMLWDLPIPQDWWFRFRRDILPTLIPTTPEPITVLPEGIVMSPEIEPEQYVLNDPFVI